MDKSIQVGDRVQVFDRKVPSNPFNNKEGIVQSLHTILRKTYAIIHFDKPIEINWWGNDHSEIPTPHEITEYSVSISALRKLKKVDLSRGM